MAMNDLPMTEAILQAEAKLREIRDVNRAGRVHEVTELAAKLGELANAIRARSIYLHFLKPMQLLPAELEEEVE